MEPFVSTAGTTLRFAGYAGLTLFLIPLLALAFPQPLRPVAKPLVSVLDRAAGAAMWVSISAAMLIILFQLAAVLLRYIFGLSFSWMTDSIVFAFATIFMLGVAGTLRADGHVRVDILRREMSAKQKAVVDLIGAFLFILPIAVLILYSASGQIARVWINLEPFNESDGLPVKYLFISLVPTFAVLLISQGLSQAIKAAFTLRDDEIAAEPPSEAPIGSV
ncbi:MAG: TRAP transporter small permease subunit [Pseudomonadota bacterium]